jgi:hypothetical protein
VEHRLLPPHFLEASFQQFYYALSAIDRAMSDLHLERAITAALRGFEELVVLASQIRPRPSEVDLQAR